MAKKEVIVVCGDKVVRVSETAWISVMDAAGKNREDWMEQSRINGKPKSQAIEALDALGRLTGIVF
jgi:hypothetical protein